MQPLARAIVVAGDSQTFRDQPWYVKEQLPAVAAIVAAEVELGCRTDGNGQFLPFVACVICTNEQSRVPFFLLLQFLVVPGLVKKRGLADGRFDLLAQLSGGLGAQTQRNARRRKQHVDLGLRQRVIEELELGQCDRPLADCSTVDQTRTKRRQLDRPEWRQRRRHAGGRHAMTVHMQRLPRSQRAGVDDVMPSTIVETCTCLGPQRRVRVRVGPPRGQTPVNIERHAQAFLVRRVEHRNQGLDLPPRFEPERQRKVRAHDAVLRGGTHRLNGIADDNRCGHMGRRTIGRDRLIAHYGKR
ncbi:Uncharacterised protein [Burkholderia pseudomallei]|nr:Uncharacterised protein [Burkholderia pseudomallei]